MAVVTREVLIKELSSTRVILVAVLTRMEETGLFGQPVDLTQYDLREALALLTANTRAINVVPHDTGGVSVWLSR